MLKDGASMKLAHETLQLSLETSRRVFAMSIVGMFITTAAAQSDSRCVFVTNNVSDTGNNGALPNNIATDLDGNDRKIDGDCDDVLTVDMGAYEYVSDCGP